MVLRIHLLSLHIISSELKSSLYSIFKNTHYKLIILVLKKHFKQIFQHLVVRIIHDSYHKRGCHNRDRSMPTIIG